MFEHFSAGKSLLRVEDEHFVNKVNKKRRGANFEEDLSVLDHRFDLLEIHLLKGGGLVHHLIQQNPQAPNIDLLCLVSL